MLWGTTEELAEDNDIRRKRLVRAMLGFVVLAFVGGLLLGHYLTCRFPDWLPFRYEQAESP